MILGCATCIADLTFSYRFAKDVVIRLAETLHLHEWYSCVQKTIGFGITCSNAEKTRVPK